jgi:site-specific recombinase XerD
MLETYFSAPKTLARLRAGLSGPYIDGFAEALEREGYSHGAALRYLRAAAHLGQFQRRRHATLADIDAKALDDFRRHQRRCRCPLSNGGKVNHHVFFGAKRFQDYLFRIGVSKHDLTMKAPRRTEPALVAAFREWFRKHRGATEPTLRHYCRDATEILHALDEDLGEWNATRIRKFLLDRSNQCGNATAEHLITAMRAFLRYLSFRGLCRSDLEQAIPSLAHWRLATLPASLTAKEVDRLVATCDGSSARSLRDRAIILLLVRLGLRAGDVVRLRFADIEWASGTLRVLGKSRSPFRPFVSNHCVSGVVKRALRRAGIVAPVKGAHLLRHTAATQMLRHGVPLDQIGLVLRHRGIDTTARYAKVDVGLLQQIAQPWPEVQS